MTNFEKYCNDNSLDYNKIIEKFEFAVEYFNISPYLKTTFDNNEFNLIYQANRAQADSMYRGPYRRGKDRNLQGFHIFIDLNNLNFILSNKSMYDSSSWCWCDNEFRSQNIYTCDSLYRIFVEFKYLLLPALKNPFRDNEHTENPEKFWGSQTIFDSVIEYINSMIIILKTETSKDNFNNIVEYIDTELIPLFLKLNFKSNRVSYIEDDRGFYEYIGIKFKYEDKYSISINNKDEKNENINTYYHENINTNYNVFNIKYDSDELSITKKIDTVEKLKSILELFADLSEEEALIKLVKYL